MLLKNLKYIILLGFILISPACTDEFLENPPLDTITDATFPVTAEDALLVTNAAYNTLRNWWIEGGYPLTDIIADDQTMGSEDGANPDLQLFEKFQYTESHQYILAMYQTLYMAIRRTNIVIENVPDINMDQELASRYVAEAKFLRSFFYFKLVGLFGGVPKITVVNPELFVPRSTEQEILNELIIPDLIEVVEILPEKSEYPVTDMGRATKGAAKALLARIYLFMGDFDNAEKYAMEVINSGQYSLDDSFAEIFSDNNSHGSGSIFEIGALQEGYGQGGNQYGNTQGVRGEPNWGWGFGRPSWDLINFYEEDDPRMDASIIFLGEILSGVEIIGTDPGTTDTTRNENGEIIEIEAYNQKVYVEGSTDPLATFGHNRRIIRYADVLLMAAEALNENDKPADALIYLNMVRKRARGGDETILPDITTTDKAELRKIIWEERRAELAFETLRFIDLKRQGRLAEVLGHLGFIEGKHEYFPIPLQEIDLSGGRLTQNPKWE